MKLTVNERKLEVTSDPETPLLWVIRDELTLMGAKFGCGAAQCGSCTMLVDGSPIRSCITPLQSVAGKNITTPEGLEGAVVEAVRKAWIHHDVAQCGFCQSGQIMGATALLQNSFAPSETDIKDAMSPYLCRCATYARIHQAILTAAQTLKG